MQLWLDKDKSANVAYQNNRVIYSQVTGRTKVYSWNVAEIKQPEYENFQAFVDS